MKLFPRLLLSPALEVIRHRALIRELTRREIGGRYRGASLGVLWSLASPFILLCIYTFAFGTVMGGRWPEPQATGTHFSVVLFAGLVVYFLVSECMVRAPDLVIGNPSFVKRVVFPLEILPWPMLLTACFHCLMNTLVFIALRLVLDGEFSWTIVMLPIVLAPMALVALGISWLLASLAVYMRDIQQVIGMASMALLFLSSVMIPTTSVPAEYRWVYQLNPLSFIVDQARAVMIWGVQPDWKGLFFYSLGAVAFMYVARAWFVATKRGFADVL
ncbi:ABC transporter permease [Luteimonas terrae]|uniref:ABC transporter permease n=1 Tax=Luteimonas terrae TaxID=1530191 RepID=UPI001FB83071|nr:ABC transporter permease [Luteimonas terrae]